MITLEAIKGLVEIETGVKDLSSKIRDKIHVDARVIYYVLAKERAKVGYCKMASFVNRNHATALHSYTKIYEQWKLFPKLYTDNLNILRRVEDTLDKDLDSILNEKTSKKLYIKYRKRNTLLYKENAELRKEIKSLEKQVNVLKKYAPIW